MKFLVEKYRVVSIWLSLLILALAFLIGSEAERRMVCVPLAFLAGVVLYGVGAVRNWTRNHVAVCLIYVLLAVFMLTATILSLLGLGGII